VRSVCVNFPFKVLELQQEAFGVGKEGRCVDGVTRGSFMSGGCATKGGGSRGGSVQKKWSVVVWQGALSCPGS
jgi:hypothetical protein